MRVLDLCSGIGGFSLGLQRAGMRTVAFCERDEFCRSILRRHWPSVPCESDLATARFVSGMADVVTAGFPCQDISFAGQGAGISGKRSGLWWKVRRTIRVVRPRFAILENVAALLRRGMGTVLGRLATLGYDAEWHCVPATAAGLPHARDRVWIVAHADSEGELQPGWSVENFRRRVLYSFQETIWPIPDSDRDGNDNGLPAAVDALGNAIVPGIVTKIGNAIMNCQQ